MDVKRQCARSRKGSQDVDVETSEGVDSKDKGEPGCSNRKGPRGLHSDTHRRLQSASPDAHDQGVLAIVDPRLPGQDLGSFPTMIPIAEA